MSIRYRALRRHDNREILTAMGLRPGQHLPTEGHPIVELDGRRYKILPKGEGLSSGTRAHRTVAECPCCGDWFCAGHIQQHIPACELKAQSADLCGPDPDDFNRYVAGDR
jgi:hypothetical protein